MEIHHHHTIALPGSLPPWALVALALAPIYWQIIRRLIERRQRG